MPLYTRRGDAGTTDLAGGQRVHKDDARVEVYGTLDELSAALGLARSLCAREARAGGTAPCPSLAALGRRLLDLQRQLSALCGWFASPGADFPRASMNEDVLAVLEGEIDLASEIAGPLRTFAMPGATALDAALHQARTVCRRAERRAVSLAREAPVDPLALAYLNRLSDWLFAQARAAAEADDAGRAADKSAERAP